jgi:adrenodoxin-NADP+ reductase
VNIVGSKAAPRRDASPPSSSLSYTYPLATPLPIASLIPHYTHILLSYGSSLSRPLGIPGSEAGELYNVHPALDFVNWYNGHPAAHDAEYLASQPWKQVHLKGLHHATVVGAGNVALDVARILLRSTSTLHSRFAKDEDIKARVSLRESDIPESVLAQLAQSDIRQVEVVARRGPAQVSFTNKELREMMDLQGVHYSSIKREDLGFAVRQISQLDESMKQNPTAQQGNDSMQAESRVRKRLLSILEKGSRSGEDSKVGWSTTFFQSPTRFTGQSDGIGRKVVKQVDWDQMAFKGLPESSEQQQPWSASAAASSNHLYKTGKTKTSATDLVITSVGYQGAPLDDSDPIQTKSGIIPWDAKRGIIPNRGGRVLDDIAQPVSAKCFSL